MTQQATLGALALSLLALVPATGVLAQTLEFKSRPPLTLQWLANVKLSASAVKAGTEITGTVTLLRAAIGEMKVGLMLTPASPVDGPQWAGESAIVVGQLRFAPGRTQRSFTITTFPPKSGASITYTISAAYGAERVSATFTVNP